MQAPLARLHEEDPGHNHASAFGHPHFGEHHGEGPEIEAGEGHDGDVSLLEWLRGDGKTAAKFAFAMPVKLFAEALLVSTIQAPEPATQSHDPPGLARLLGRSPLNYSSYTSACSRRRRSLLSKKVDVLRWLYAFLKAGLCGRIVDARTGME